MALVLSEHAKERMLERGITHEFLLNRILKGVQYRNGANGMKFVHGKYFAVVRDRTVITTCGIKEW